VRERLQSGDLWVEGTREHLRFDSYMLPPGKAAEIALTLPFDTDVGRYLEGRARLLDWRLRRFAGSLKRGTLDGVELRGGNLRVSPLAAVTPAAADRLDAAVDRLMPRVRITELLAEVEARTGFLCAFPELRSGRAHSNPQAVLDALEADGGSSVELFTRSGELVAFLIAQNPPAPELARINAAIAKVKPFTVVDGKILITVP
jgi:hypothetical protein